MSALRWDDRPPDERPPMPQALPVRQSAFAVTVLLVALCSGSAALTPFLGGATEPTASPFSLSAHGAGTSLTSALPERGALAGRAELQTPPQVSERVIAISADVAIRSLSTVSVVALPAEPPYKNLGLDGWRKQGSPLPAQIVDERGEREIDVNELLARAESLIDSPYYFAGQTPEGFDCSGFTRFLFAYFGILLPHGVTSQAELGKHIPASQAQLGDLVVRNDYSHIGVYVGDGQMIHSPQPGDSVKRSLIGDMSTLHFVRIGH
jgi:cell wall-associated NlpC family hydrolase